MHRTTRFASLLLCWLIGWWSLSYASFSLAENAVEALASNRHSMHEVIITAAQPLALIDMPRSVSVISADDISRSGAKSIQELLATQANIVLSSFSGNEKFTRIDIRGSGDTSVSNVLTLVDGMRINTPIYRAPTFRQFLCIK